MQKQRYHSDGSCQGRFANPRVAVQEHRGAGGRRSEYVQEVKRVLRIPGLVRRYFST